MKFNKNEIYEFLTMAQPARYDLMKNASKFNLTVGQQNFLIYKDIIIDLDISNEFNAYIYEPTLDSWEICDEEGSLGSPDSERFKLNEKMTAYFEKQKLEQQIAKQPETPRIKMKI